MTLGIGGTALPYPVFDLYDYNAILISKACKEENIQSIKE